MKNKKEKNTKKSKKKIVLTIIIVIILISAVIGIILLNKNKSNKKVEPKETIILNDNLKFEINSEVNLLSLISDDNKVKIISEDELIDTSTLGEKDIYIKYVVEGKEQEKKITINIVDTQTPQIEYNKELSTEVGTKLDLLKDVTVTDNSKEEIKATIEGEYDFNKEGTYNLKYVAIDSSNNKIEESFVLKVVKKEKTNNTSNNSNSNTNSSSGNSNSNNTSSNNSKPNNSSGTTSTPKPSNTCGSKGYTYSQSVAYAFWGCNGSEPVGGMTSKINDELFGPAGTKELNACKAHFGNNDCSDWVNIIPILDNATGKVVGYYAKFQMEYGDWDNLQIVGTGYMLPGRVVMTSKSY